MSTSQLIAAHAAESLTPTPDSTDSTSSPPSFQLRLFEQADLPLCRSLLNTTNAEFVSDPEKAKDEAYVASFLRADMSDIRSHYLLPPRSTFFVVADPSGIIGTAGLRPLSVADPDYFAACTAPGAFPTPFSDPSNVLELNRMAVHPRARRRGVASALGDACAGFARDCGASGIHLVTAIGIGSARALYKRLGYVEYRVDRFDIAAYQGRKREPGELKEDELPRQNVPLDEVPSTEVMTEQRKRGIWHVGHFFQHTR